ncbi:hypothetical protein LC608_30580 [Nostoc sp. XA010]|uniref:hypothetical protein n=1 Tax=Nostoc sp. XA010 TaxID=2780407 RepID=UPI001E3E1CB7|nr:hypothetical protein [Nostoc sp. XA010]MCC5661232.1 hypothetical protein [Nostoc sp. XA010]
MQKLCVAAVGTAFIALESLSMAPATAALLTFSFSTESGGIGSFTLDTKTVRASEPAVFGAGFTGILYPKAVSNLSLSASYTSLRRVTADWVVAPSFTSDLLGLPESIGVLSGAVYPSGCSNGTSVGCSVTVGVIYSGNASEPSPNPDSYPIVLAVELFEPTTQQLLIRESITKFQVVPESNSNLSILAFGIGGISLLLKHKLKEKLLTAKE